MFSRTPSGIRNTPLFHGDSYLVIVEGTQDQPFWSNFFPEQIGGYKRKIKAVGGRLEIQKYIDQLLLRDAKFVVAIDSDYRLILGKLHSNTRIIETQYHSIENLMLHSLNITKLIRNLSYDVEYTSSKVDAWLEHFDETLYSLMVADVLIEQHKLGYQCVGDNCSPFLMVKNKPEFDVDKINNAIQKLSLPQDKLNEISQKLKDYEPRFHIRGHFFFSAVLGFTTSEVKRIRNKAVSISNDSFFTMSLTSLETCFSSNLLLKTLREQAVEAAKEVTSLLKEEA